ncbi:hypothetical protein [Marinobacterium aestuariivivens]|uniref:Uncharacterized protein n=1 Tax=Marinobacterium aestuariivivens TaxID=1698799 RepID=A0ABW1ZUN2_9GAMM
MKVSVWGDELAAWVVAAQLAAFGNEVQLCAGEVWGRTEAGKSIYPSHKAISAEPGLMELLQEGYGSGRLRAVPADEAFSAPVHWLGMAPDRLDEAVDLIRRIAEGGAKPCLVVNQSNFGIGASDRLQSLLDLDAGQAVVCLPDSLQEETRWRSSVSRMRCCSAARMSRRGVGCWGCSGPLPVPCARSS